MPEFKGFPEGKVHQVPIPAPFFKELLPRIDHLGELKISLYFFWRLARMEGPFRFLRASDLAGDEALMRSLGPAPEAAEEALEEALTRAVSRGTLLQADITQKNTSERIYLLNSPKGRAALRAIESGKWRPPLEGQETPLEVSEPPNIFRLYEENIGALTPMIADALVEAEETYPAVWIEEAIQIAVRKNKRNWAYALAILERWRREGKHGGKEKSEDRRDSEEARRRYVEGEYSDFVEH
jgi:DnaD/phage-associated family protein